MKKIHGLHGFKKMTESTRRIIEIIRSVPPGKAASYRDVALMAGLPNGARQVARILHSMSETQKLPWHRIVRADGRIALPAEHGGDLQAALLRAEGVKVSKTLRVTDRLYSFTPNSKQAGNITKSYQKNSDKNICS